MNYLKILGVSGSKTQDQGTTSFQVHKDILIDAGNVISSLGEHTLNINHIFITHSHSDHILDLPFIIESFFEKREETLKIYGSKQTIKALKDHTFNDQIWPDFSRINLLNSDKKALEFVEIELNQELKFHEHYITAIEATHIEGSYGYKIINGNSGYIISGDTYENEILIDELNKDKRIKSLIVECSFPNHMEKLAKQSKHLTPKLLSNMIKKIKRDDLKTFIYHLKPVHKIQMIKEIEESVILENGGKILEEGDIIHIKTAQVQASNICHNRFEKIMDINLELSSELDKDKLFEMILTLTRELTHCEAGTLYIKSKDGKYLDFKVVQNSPLNIFMDTRKNNLEWDSLPLYLEDGSVNKHMVAAVSALENKTVNIDDVYENKEYDFKGAKKFDEMTGFRSKSMLVTPLVNHEQEVIGVLQLINKKESLLDVIPFDTEDEKIIKSLSSQGAMALTNTQLILNLEDFLNSFVKTIGHAIDAKSPHTKNHISKVSKIALLIANAINEDETIYKDVKYTKNDLHEINLAAHMHDIGKISIPESVIDKSKKLECIVDRIEFIKQRAEILKRDFEIALLKNEIKQDFYEKSIEKIKDDILFLEETNIGEEFMDDKRIHRIDEIANYKYLYNGIETSFLSQDEIYNLSIRKGTLTSEEKDIMNSHAKLSYDMLTALPFPKKYKNVLDIAANHHEKLNGKGYPRALKEEQLSLEDRIMILSDIFEALTASDRPYKEGKKLSEVFKILSFMAKDNEIDAQLLKFFFEHDVLKEYVQKELKAYQIDNASLNL